MGSMGVMAGYGYGCQVRLPGVQVARGPGAGCQRSGPGCRLPDVRSRVPDVRCQVPGARCQIPVRLAGPGGQGTGF